MMKDIGLHRFYAYPRNDLSFTLLFRTRGCSTGRNTLKAPDMPGPQNTVHFPVSSGTGAGYDGSTNPLPYILTRAFSCRRGKKVPVRFHTPNLHDLPGRPRASPEGTGRRSSGARDGVKDRFPYHILVYRVSPDRNNPKCSMLVSATKKFTVQNNIQFP